MSSARRFIRTIQAQQSKKALCLAVGSSHTFLSIGEKIVYNQASCLAVHRGSNEVLAVGDKAYQLLGKTGSHIEVVFPVQNGSISSSKYFRLLLTAVQNEVGLGAVTLPFLGQQSTLVASPDTFSPVEQKYFERDLTQTQWGKLQFVSKSLAIANGLDRLTDSNKQLCLIIIGGMATEIVVISGEEVIATQRFHLGGVHFTEAVQEIIRAEQQCAVSWHVAEAVKQSLGFIDATIVPRTIRQKKMSVQGKDISSQLGKTVVVESASFLPLFSTLVDDLLLNIQSFFAQLPTDLSTSVLSEGLILSGGTARMQGLAEYLSEQLHSEVTASATPELDVINGLIKINQK
jgi:rod shape-determining protein MreB